MFTILLVEDESIIARDIGRVVEKLNGARFLEADTYEAAIDIIDREIPDLVLLDIRLYEDKEAGLRIARYLNNKYRIPFIFLSGYATDNYLQKARKEMPVTFIVKPVDNRQLEVTLIMAMKEQNNSKLKHIQFHGRLFERIKEVLLTPEFISSQPLSFENIRPENIILIKTFNHIRKNTVLIKLKEDNCLLAYLNIQQVMDLLPGNFVKVHSSFIVNKDHVTGLIGNSSVKVGEELIHFGTEFRKKKSFRLFRD